MSVTVYRDEADQLWTWACHPDKRYLTAHEAYVAATAAHPEQAVTVDQAARA